MQQTVPCRHTSWDGSTPVDSTYSIPSVAWANKKSGSSSRARSRSSAGSPDKLTYCRPAEMRCWNNRCLHSAYARAAIAAT